VGKTLPFSVHCQHPVLINTPHTSLMMHKQATTDSRRAGCKRIAIVQQAHCRVCCTSTGSGLHTYSRTCGHVRCTSLPATAYPCTGGTEASVLQLFLHLDLADCPKCDVISSGRRQPPWA
jgi:hypothetical protein